MSIVLKKIEILHENNPILLLSKKREYFMKEESYYAAKSREIEKQLIEYHVYGKKGHPAKLSKRS